MSLRLSLVLLSLVVALGGSHAAPGASPDSTAPSVERRYCTQFGPFFVRFDLDKAAGVFAIRANHDLGAMVGTLSNHQLDGAWMENDSRGRIRMTFSDDWSSFEAEYSLDSEPESWRGGWRGVLPANGEPTELARDGTTYDCR